MIVADLLGWWYSRGWVWLARKIFIEKSYSISSFFSIGDLFKTLFSPFRQDSIALQNAPIGIRLQAFGGNLISRIFGFIIRSTLIFMGVAALLVNALAGFIVVVIWPLLPISPIVSFVLVFSGVGGL